MEIKPAFLVPYVISNVVALIMLVLAWKKPGISRLLYFLIFLWASIVNASTAIKSPEVYLEYSEYTFLAVYRIFINGIFSEHITIFVLFIATSQFCIAILLLTSDSLIKIGLVGGIIFFISIAPLGVGAAFPSSIIWALGLIVLFRKNLSVFKFNFRK